jgi:hypothetical protein
MCRGCKLTTQYSYPSHSPSKQSHTSKATYYLSCTHAIKGRFSGSSVFNDDDIGPINVVTEQIKRTKTKGSMKGNMDICLIFVPLYTNSHATIWILLIRIVRFYKRFIFHRNQRHGFQVQEENHYCQETNCKEMSTPQTISC